MSKPGRNDLCPCGSQKKYKYCCMLKNPTAHIASRITASQPRLNALLENASLLFQQGQLNQAAVLCQNILSQNPKYTKALCLLGIIAFQTNQVELSMGLLERTTSLEPSYAEAWNNLGVVYKELGKHTKAQLAFQRAIESNHSYIDALINMGNAMQDERRYNDAINYYNRVLHLKPDHTGALSNLANLLQELNKHDQAISVFDRLLKIDPNYDYAFGSKLYSKLYCCDWSDFDTSVEIILSSIDRGQRIAKPFDLLAFADAPEHQLKCAQLFIQDKYPTQTPIAATSKTDTNGRINLAYLSADFRQHAVSQLLVQLIERHDREKFNVIGISWGAEDNSELRKRIVAAFDVFIDVSDKSDKEVALMIKNMGIDIAIDLMGFTTNSRTGIFSYRPAKVQAGYLGFAGTSGADYLDYIMADSTVIPDNARQFYAEKVIHIPGCFQPNDSSREIAPDTPSKSSAGLPEDAFVFCAFNNHYKITPLAFSLWMQILLNTPNSVLWLSPCNEIAKMNLCETAAKAGVEPSRLIFAERTTHLRDHLARHRLADLFLDTFPYNAHTTASDALWAGLPVLTYSGSSYASRVATSLLQSCGLGELVISHTRDYVKMACELAIKSDRLSALQQKLLTNRNSLPLFNPDYFIPAFEQSLVSLLNK